MSNVVTMILVLGGTLSIAMVLLYFSLLSGRPHQPATTKKRQAEAATAVLAATSRKD